MPSTISASAPGKVLIIGGYLVLQEGTSGLVISATSRFVATLKREGKETTKDESFTVPLVVESPQFHRNWDYLLHVDADNKALFVSAKDPASRNTFVEEAINTALAAAVGKNGFAAACTAASLSSTASLSLLLQADNDFYSQRSHLIERGLPVCSASLASLPRFMPCPRDAETGKAVVNKTGLGSSAALTTAVCAAILGLTGAASALQGEEGAQARALVHVSAQVAHGLAQGKVGSGFDVCSAAYGSCSYTRVPPSVLGAFMAAMEKALPAVKANAEGSQQAYADVTAQLAAAAEKEASVLSKGGRSVDAGAAAAAAAGGWSVGVEAFGLPPGLRLLLADVVGGSETPSMVRQVLAWKEGKTKRSDEEVAKASEHAEGAGAAERLDALDLSSSSSSSPKDGDIMSCFSFLSSPSSTPAEEVEEQRAAMLAAIRSSEGAGPALWKGAAAANARASVVVEQLRKLSSSSSASYRSALAKAADMSWASSSSALPSFEGASASVSENERRVLSKLTEFVQSFADCRFILRAIGNAAGVPIEPKEQTELADATLSKVKGVLAAGVPGAGGFDALFAIHVQPELAADDAAETSSSSSSSSSVREAIEKLWLEWPGGGLTPLLLSNGPAHGEKGAGAEITVSP